MKGISNTKEKLSVYLQNMKEMHISERYDNRSLACINVFLAIFTNCFEVGKAEKIRNRYNQGPHLTQDST